VKPGTKDMGEKWKSVAIFGIFELTHGITLRWDQKYVFDAE
jgi:hypothetical protein